MALGVRRLPTSSDNPQSAGEEFVPAEHVADGKFIRGRDGRLFLARDTNDVLAQHAGELLFESEELDRWTALLERRHCLLAECGIEYLFVIAPDAHSVYPDQLPAGVNHGQRRPVVQLLDHLAQRACPVRPIYPLAELRETRAGVDCYSRLDSHWNDVGAFVAYSRLAEEMQRRSPMRRLREDDVVFVTKPTMAGDLGYKVNAEPELVPVAEMRVQRARLVRDNRVQNTGSLISTFCPDAPGSCVLMGDSYSWGVLKYLAESFRRCTFAYTPTLDLEFLKDQRPDVVVSLMAERMLIRVPDDERGASIASLAARKLTDEGMRRRAVYWGLAWQGPPT
jgi:hypothetical protein